MSNNHGKWAPAEIDSTGDSYLDNMYYTSARRKAAGAPVQSEHDADGFGKSRTEIFAEASRKAATKASLEKLSAPRQAYLQSVASRSLEHNPRPNLDSVIGASRPSLIKQASSGAISSHVSGTSSINAVGPELYSPLYLTANLMLPRDRITANAWNRAFYETNPLVRNAINLHATYPISKLSIKCEDKKVEQFFEDLAEKVDLISVVQNTALEYWKLGEVINYASFDSESGTWDKIYQLNPDFVVVKQSPIPGVVTIALRPDPELQKIVHGTDPVSIRMRQQLPEQVIHHVMMNEPIPLDSFNVSHLKNLSSPYDVRGTSVIVSVWKDLVMLDKYRECKLVQADSMVNPLTLVKIGASNPDGHYPRPEDLAAWREVFEQAQYDKDFKIFTHPDVNVTPVGYSGQTLDVTQDVQLAMDNVLTGLMVPKAILTQEGAPYANASVALDVMRQRYNNFRTMMANWLEKKIFAPISEVQGFYKYEKGEKKLIVPKVEWNHMTLYDVDTYISHLLQLIDKAAPTTPGGVSRKTLYRSLGLNFQDEVANIKQEFIDLTILQKEMMELQKMELSKLRSLDPEKPIVESQDMALPGMPGGPGGPSLPGAAPGGGDLSSLLGGGPPADMGGMPGGAAPTDMGAPPAALPGTPAEAPPPPTPGAPT
jgi:hypothetical protein